MTEPRVLAVVSDYLGLVAALRRRLTVELGISFEVIDALAGWTDTYATKLLAPEPLKHLGPMSFDTLLGVAAVKLALIDDPERRAAIKSHRDYVLRKYAVSMPVSIKRPSMRFNPKRAREMTANRIQKIPEKRRRAIAKKAAKTRWGRN